jgi:hypothetical protein
MTNVTFSTKFETENILSDLERVVLEGTVFTQDMALKLVARFNTFDKTGSGYIGTRK